MKTHHAILPILVLLMASLSCSTYRVKKDMGSGKSFESLKSTGIIIRIAEGSMVSRDELNRNVAVHLASYTSKRELKVIHAGIQEIDQYKGAIDRLYQVSNENDYLPYKTRGMLTWFLNKHRETLREVLNSHELDSLIIYEIEGGYYPNMGFIGFNSVVALVDVNLSINYMDHNNVSFELEGFDPEAAKVSFLDRVTDRLLSLLVKMKILDRIPAK